MQKSGKNGAYRRKPAQQRQQELIEAGILCLEQGGMPAFTIDAICTRADVSRGLVNHHFRTKQEFLVRIYDDMTGHLVNQSAGADSSTQLGSIIDSSFDEGSFNRSNLRAWLALWGQVPVNSALRSLHRKRYRIYRNRIKKALKSMNNGVEPDADTDSVARQLIALIDGLWLEYCLNSDDFSLAAAKRDCYRFLASHGIDRDQSGGNL